MNKELWFQIMLKFHQVLSTKTSGVHYVILQNRLSSHTDPMNLMEIKMLELHPIMLLANTFHFLQPLDSFLFANFKNFLNNEAKKKYTVTLIII